MTCEEVKEEETMGEVSNKENKEPVQRILDAALDVVNRETISGTRMHLIADQAQMVQSNIHYYYKTKNDLMLALQDYIFEECYEIRRKEKKASKDTLESQMSVFINQKQKLIRNKNKYDFAEIDFWVQSKKNEDIHLKFVESYEKWKREIGEILDRYCAELEKECREMLPYMVISLLQGATIQCAIHKDNFNMDSYFNACKDMILNQIKIKSRTGSDEAGV